MRHCILVYFATITSLACTPNPSEASEVVVAFDGAQFRLQCKKNENFSEEIAIFRKEAKTYQKNREQFLIQTHKERMKALKSHREWIRNVQDGKIKIESGKFLANMIIEELQEFETTERAIIRLDQSQADFLQRFRNQFAHIPGYVSPDREKKQNYLAMQSPKKLCDPAASLKGVSDALSELDLLINLRKYGPIKNIVKGGPLEPIIENERELQKEILLQKEMLEDMSDSYCSTTPYQNFGMKLDGNSLLLLQRLRVLDTKAETIQSLQRKQINRLQFLLSERWKELSSGIAQIPRWAARGELDGVLEVATPAQGPAYQPPAIPAIPTFEICTATQLADGAVVTAEPTTSPVKALAGPTESSADAGE